MKLQTKLPKVENETMNNIHDQEVQIIEELSKYIEIKDYDLITSQITKLITHMQEHFSFEEKLMKENRYQMYTVHQSDHNKVLNEARYMMMDWRTAKDIDRLKEYFEEELLQWLDQHIKAMDTPMAEYLSSIK